LLDKEEYVEKNYNRNLQVIEAKRAKSIKDAEDAYEASLRYYDNEKQMSLSKCKKEYDLRRRTLEAKGERYDAEKSAVSKTSTEITLDMQKYKILKELKSSIDIMAMSRNSVQNGKFIQPLPTLPEPLPSQAVIQSQEEKPKVNINDWLNSVGEDASLAILRAEARADDARKRKEAEEAEMRREERMLQYRRQLDRDAEQRRWEREQRDKEEIQHQPLTQLQVVTEKEESSDKEEEDEMTQEEMDEYIAKRKLEMKKGFSLKSPA